MTSAARDSATFVNVDLDSVYTTKKAYEIYTGSSLS